MEKEVSEFGTDDDRYCLDYVLRKATGSSTREWPNGILDQGRPAGLFLADFASDPSVKLARLGVAHVAALRYVLLI